MNKGKYQGGTQRLLKLGGAAGVFQLVVTVSPTHLTVALCFSLNRNQIAIHEVLLVDQKLSNLAARAFGQDYEFQLSLPFGIKRMSNDS